MVNSTGDAIRQMIRLVCASLKNYFMVHLHIKSQEIRRAKMIHSDQLTSVSGIYYVVYHINKDN